jgi:hypothetical protein
MTEVVVVSRLKFRKQIPASHRKSLDTRMVWLWHQRFGTVQTIWRDTSDILDKTACTVILQAIIAKDLESIGQIFQRLEGGVLDDQTLAEISVEEIEL